MKSAEPALIRPGPFRLVLLAAAVIAFLGTLVRSDDPDMFHHLAFGREIVRSGLQALEPFVYPLRGVVTGPPTYWLGSVTIFGWHALFGDAGLSLLPATIGALLAVVLLLDSTPRAGRHTVLTVCAAVIPVALAIETYRYRAVARTEIFSALLLAVTMWAIRRFEDGLVRPLLALPIVAVLWTNLHPGVAVSLAPLAILVCCGVTLALIRRVTGRAAPGAPRWREIGVAAAVLTAVAIASALTPARANPIVEAMRFVSAAIRIGGSAGATSSESIAFLANIQEMRGGGYALWGTPVGALIALSALSFLLRPRSIRFRELITVVAFAVLPFVAVRFAIFFAIVAAPIAARNLGEATAALPDRLGSVPARTCAAVGLALAAVASTPLGAQAPHIRFGAGVSRGVFPVRGVDYLQALRFDGALFNTLHFGGYLEWREVGPPFQDGRGAIKPEDAAAALSGPTVWPSFMMLDSRYHFDALLVSYPAGDPASGARFGVFEPDRSTWSLVAFDDAGLLYLRRDGKYAEAAARDEFRSITPASPLLALPPLDPAGELADYRRSVREAPDCFRCRYFLGELALATGTPEEAARVVAPAISRAFGPERDVLESVATRAADALRTAGAGGVLSAH